MKVIPVMIVSVMNTCIGSGFHSLDGASVSLVSKKSIESLPTLLSIHFSNISYLPWMEIIDDYAQFFTATITDWVPVLEFPETKKIILDSLQFLVENKRAYIYAFVIMNNHIHLIWQIRSGFQMQEVQRDFLKFTGQQLKFFLQNNGHDDLLKKLEVNRKDRKYQIWQRNSLNVPLSSHSVLLQKLVYIHNNPVKAGLCQFAATYRYSSARYYEHQDDSFSFLSHYDG